MRRLLSWRSVLLPLTVLVAVAAIRAVKVPAADDTGKAKGGELTVHEWGTFTSVAGPDGASVSWTPLNGPADLPKFVTIVNPKNIKGTLGDIRATVRMETPVLYFYAPQDQTVRVNVRFPHGSITEWYPSAKLMDGELWKQLETEGGIEWPAVKIKPKARPQLPSGNENSHYYAARATDAAPVQVGSQFEKFLFYRGLATFSIPVSARIAEQGRVVVRSLGRDEVAGLILFESRNGNMGFRMLDSLRGEAVLEPPTLDSNFELLRAKLEATLTAQGLYPLEARAMVETWKDTWFEEGSRLFYIVPKPALENILPLKIEPKPAHVARVFVGRVESLTPTVQEDAKRAILENDTPSLAKKARFLQPIASAILEGLPASTDPESRRRIQCVTAGSLRPSDCPAGK